MKYLVIVESPSKCKKIEKYLNDNDDFHIYEVVATMGHITELNSLKNINIENNFACDYELIKLKIKNTEAIRKKIKEFDEVIICSDPDREGEGIAMAICDVFKLDAFKTKRVIFHEITESAITKAIKNPRCIDMNLVHAQQTRQILDLLVGYKVSPILWKYITKYAEKSLSAGRCQTPALRVIYENQQEINKEEAKKVYNIQGYFTKMNIPFELNVQMETDKEVQDFLSQSIHHSHSYSCTLPIQVEKKPPEPFTTSKIQQIASNELHFTPKETMKLCQTLYEEGYITYMRTDSKTYSSEFIENVKEYITRNYAEGEKYINENIENRNANMNSNQMQFHNNKTKNKNNTNIITQDAHEAIRPTNISLYELPENVNSKEKKMYKLIWENTLQSCMSSAFFYAITASISGYNNHIFKHTCEQVSFPGWMIVSKKCKENTKEYTYLQNIKQKEIIPYKKIMASVTLKGLKQHYTEARLIQILEEKGIGRPSTFASIVEKIQEREYVKKTNISGKKIICKDFELEDGTIIEKENEKEFGNEKNKLVMQTLGTIIMDFLDTHFFSLFNYDYTKKMEDDLDTISKGEMVWQDVCSNCNAEIDRLILGIKEQNKIEFKIDESNTYMIGKYGPVIKHTETINGKEEISFKPVKKDIDIHQIESSEIKLEEIIDLNVKKKQNILGNYKGDDVIIKKGKYGLYITWGENSKTLKELGNRPLENITFDEVTKYLEEGSNIIREVSSAISIRKGNGAKRDYILYKTPKMKKPLFYDLHSFYKDTQNDYKTCDMHILKNWIKNTHNIS